MAADNPADEESTHNTLTMTDVKNDTGKRMPTWQIKNWVVKQGLSVGLFTIKGTTKSFVKQIGSISLAVSHYFATAYLKEFPHDVVGFKWNKEEMVNI